METWKDIPEYEGLYQISSYGRVKSLAGSGKSVRKEKILKPSIKKGYLKVMLWKNKEYHVIQIHRTVAQQFVPNLQNKPNVNHLDGDTKNNHWTNLEWCTQKENIYHSKNVTKNGTVISRKAFLELFKENSHLSAQEFVDLVLPYFK